MFKRITFHFYSANQLHLDPLNRLSLTHYSSMLICTFTHSPDTLLLSYPLPSPLTPSLSHHLLHHSSASPFIPSFTLSPSTLTTHTITLPPLHPHSITHYHFLHWFSQGFCYFKDNRRQCQLEWTISWRSAHVGLWRDDRGQKAHRHHQQSTRERQVPSRHKTAQQCGELCKESISQSDLRGWMSLIYRLYPPLYTYKFSMLNMMIFRNSLSRMPLKYTSMQNHFDLFSVCWSSVHIHNKLILKSGTPDNMNWFHIS